MKTEEQKLTIIENRIKRQISLISTIQDMLAQAKDKGDNRLVKILEKQIRRAELGDLDSAKFILDRAFGTPVQTVETHSETDLNININIHERQKNV